MFRREKCLSERIKNVEFWLCAQFKKSNETWISILLKIVKRIRIDFIKNSNDINAINSNQEFQNHVYFCVHVKTYLIFCYVIKHANIELLRHVLHQIVVMFQVEKADVSQYAQFLFYMFYLTVSFVVIR